MALGSTGTLDDDELMTNPGRTGFSFIHILESVLQKSPRRCQAPCTLSSCTNGPLVLSDCLENRGLGKIKEISVKQIPRYEKKRTWPDPGLSLAHHNQKYMYMLMALGSTGTLILKSVLQKSF